MAVAFADGRHTHGDQPHISVTTSLDGGETWNQPSLISSLHNGPAWLPSLAWRSPHLLAIAYFDGGPGSNGEANLRLARVGIDEAGMAANLGERLIDRFPMLAHPAEKHYFLADYYPTIALGTDTAIVYVRTRCGDAAL